MKKGAKRYWLIPQLLLMVSMLLVSCEDRETLSINEADREALVAKLYEYRDNGDSLQVLLDDCLERKDKAGAVMAYRQMGRYQRNNARFSEAILSHQAGLSLALELADTLEIIQAYNNLGTNFRRIGALSEASNYHYQALAYSDAYSGGDDPTTAMKNRVVSLNGLGNICLILGYYDQADQHFRWALKDEIKLESALGQAINYANIGSIFEHHNELDSARLYYTHSMEQNMIAKSDLGIGLCYIHFGDLYSKEGKYQLAKEEYMKALQLMQHISDRWHWLRAALAIAEVSLELGDYGEFEHYIGIAEKTAEEINSPEHLARIYGLKHTYYLKREDFANAMKNYKRSVEMNDSIQGVQKSNIYADMRLNFEREKSQRHIASLEAEAKEQEMHRRMTLRISIILLVIGGITIGLLVYAIRQRSRRNKLLREMERMRSDFFTNITHEIRTPLTVIQGLNNQLKKGDELTGEEKTKFREAIDRQSNHLLAMVNQLLDAAKVGSNSDKPDWRHGDIVPQLQMQVESFGLFAQAKGMELRLHTEQSACAMDFVPFYLERIVSNLLSNAIKHSKKGDEIILSLSVDSARGSVALEVEDHGEGIAPDELEHIFEMFYQTPTSSKVGGSGIGLAFVQLMVKRMRGEVRVKSELGKGSTFTVILPIKNPQLSEIKPLSANEVGKIGEVETSWVDEEGLPLDADDTEASATQPLILLVEDNSDVAMYVKSLLKGTYHVLTATNGKEGLELAEQYVPDLVITDVMMPVMDGFQLCKEMKYSQLLNHIPIIMLTAKATVEDKMRGLTCGIHSFLPKPFQPEELTLLIANILDSRERLKEKYLELMVSSPEQVPSKEQGVEGDENIAFLQAVNEILHKEIANSELNAACLAEEMNLSTSQLNRKMKGVTGLSTIAYLLKVRLTKAHQMLLGSDTLVVEVAEACGFNDVSYFNRAFKKEFDQTPSQIRKSIDN